jgi:hypothetical protein
MTRLDPTEEEVVDVMGLLYSSHSYAHITGICSKSHRYRRKEEEVVWEEEADTGRRKFQFGGQSTKLFK